MNNFNPRRERVMVTKRKKEHSRVFSYKEWFLNGLYFTFVFVAALLISTQALARKVNTFQTITEPIFFYVDKQDITVSSTVASRVKEVLVTPGQHVSKGDLMIRLDGSDFKRKLDILQDVADENLSARTELNILKENQGAYNVYAPQDGVVYRLHVAEGSYVSVGEDLLTMFADRDARLISYVTPAQYREIQSVTDIDVYSRRLEQAFRVKLEGISRVTYGPTSDGIKDNQGEDRRYELIFRFANPQDGAIFIEQESLQLIKSVNNNAIKRPLNQIADLWNALIIGK